MMIDSDHDAWLRVRLDIHNGTTAKDRQLWPLAVHQQTGVAQLHQDCWELLMSQNGRKRTTFAKQLNQAADTAEFFDSQVNMSEKAIRVAQILRQAKHAIAFTGAGISTAAGIGDFRGIFGQWTQDDLVLQPGGIPNDNEKDNRDDVLYEDLRPTLAHEALHWLMEHGMLNHVTTQNCDGLHRLSGIPADQLSELHGNVFIEYCRQCNTEYERNKCVGDDEASLYYEEIQEHGYSSIKKPKASQCPQCRLTHETKRKCTTCKKPLYDTIINFGDDLRHSQYDLAAQQSQAADVILVLGSTLRVTPAANLCEPSRRSRRDPSPRLVICNRQETAQATKPNTLRVHGDCDQLMMGVLKELMDDVGYQEWLAKRSQRLEAYDKVRGNRKRKITRG